MGVILYRLHSKRLACDRCDGQLYQRSDDTKEVIQNRLKVYHEQTAPLIDFYGKKKTLQTIDSDQSKEAITLEILKILRS